tara:strand:+ start:975 stop:1127 length:153 start_codon:yes stop_codon:yes gene_type:complete
MKIIAVILSIMFISILIFAAYGLYIIHNIGEHFRVDHLEVKKVNNDRRDI